MTRSLGYRYGKQNPIDRPALHFLHVDLFRNSRNLLVSLINGEWGLIRDRSGAGDIH